MGDWGKRIRVVFDGKLYNVLASLNQYFRIKETEYGTYIYPTSITYGENDHELYLEFDNLNQRVLPFELEYLGGALLGGVDFALDPFSIVPVIQGLHPKEGHDYLGVGSIDVTGTIAVAFDYKLYGEMGHLGISSITVGGTCSILTYAKRYGNDYLSVNSITVAGQYCDVNGNPL